MPKFKMATSTIKDTKLKTKVLWTNPNPTTQMASKTINLNDSGSYSIVVVRFRQYTGDGVYYVNQMLTPYELSNRPLCSCLVSSVRWDGSINYIIGRQMTYYFDNNNLWVGPAYRQDTYKTSVEDNNCLVPYQVIAYY